MELEELLEGLLPNWHSLNHTAFKFGGVMIHPYALILTLLVQENLTSNPRHF